MRFLLAILTLYVILLPFFPQIIQSAILYFVSLLVRLAPIFLVVILLMALTNYFFSPKSVLKGKKGWITAIVGGILSSGPIYVWYPFLAELKEKGTFTYGQIACFLYNRAVKIPLIPIMAAYFGWKYVFVLTALMVAASVIQGLIIDKLMEVKT